MGHSIVEPLAGSVLVQKNGIGLGQNWSCNSKLSQDEHLSCSVASSTALEGAEVGGGVMVCTHCCIKLRQMLGTVAEQLS